MEKYLKFKSVETSWNYLSSFVIFWWMCHRKTHFWHILLQIPTIILCHKPEYVAKNQQNNAGTITVQRGDGELDKVLLCFHENKECSRWSGSVSECLELYYVLSMWLMTSHMLKVQVLLSGPRCLGGLTLHSQCVHCLLEHSGQMYTYQICWWPI